MSSSEPKPLSTLEHLNSLFSASAPSAQNAVSIFPSWASRFPDASGISTTGTAGLFEDPKIIWLRECLHKFNGRGFDGLDVLELGPLEAGHTYMMDRFGAKHIDAVEANSLAYLKCLVAKEVMGIKTASFHFGDALGFLDQAGHTYDLSICSGLLYHMQDPVGLLRKLAKASNAIYVWTNTYTDELFVKHPLLRPNFGPPVLFSDHGFQCQLYPHFYGEVTDYAKFWGAGTASCYWMSPDDVSRVVEYAGFTVRDVRAEDNPFGVAINLFATK